MKSYLQIFTNLNEEKRCLFCFSTSLCIVVLMLGFVLAPMIEEAITYKEERIKLEERASVYERFACEMGEDYKKIVASQNQKLDWLKQRLPAKLEQAVLMDEVYATAERSNVNLISLREIRKGSLEKHASFLQMQCKGNYNDVLKFLVSLEQEGCFKSLEEFSVHGDELTGHIEASAVVVSHTK